MLYFQKKLKLVSYSLTSRRTNKVDNFCFDNGYYYCVPNMYVAANVFLFLLFCIKFDYYEQFYITNTPIPN